MRAMVRRLWVLATTAWLGAMPAPAQQDLGPLLAQVPDTAIAVAAAAEPGALLRHLGAFAEPVPVGLPPDVTAAIGAAVALVRTFCDGAPDAWLERLAGGGAVAAWSPPDGGAAGHWLLVLRPDDLAAAEAWCAERARGALRSTRDGLLLLGAGAAAVPGSWAQTDLAVRAAAHDGVVAEIDLARLRRRAGADAIAALRADGVARWAFAPVVQALESGERLRLELAASAARIRLLAAFGGTPIPTAEPDPGATPLVVVAALRLERSLRELLAAPERVLDAGGVQAVRGFLSIADALDGPQSSFVDDLLGGLHEPLVLHVLPVPPAPDVERAPLCLPQFVVSAAVADAAAVDAALRTARNLATIANAERMQRGAAPFVLRTRSAEDGHGLVAEPPPWRGPGAPPVDRQLSPAVWHGNGRLAIATTLSAARAVCAAPALPAVGPGDRLLLRGPALAAAIAQSRGVLELARMLDEGEPPGDARRFFDVVIAVTDALASLDLAVTRDAPATTLRLDLERRR